jgi:hypothetical protein
MLVITEQPRAYRPDRMSRLETALRRNWRPYRLALRPLGITAVQIDDQDRPYWRMRRTLGPLFVNYTMVCEGEEALVVVGDIVSIPDPYHAPANVYRDARGNDIIEGGELILGLFSAVFDGKPLDAPVT